MSPDFAVGELLAGRLRWRLFAPDGVSVFRDDGTDWLFSVIYLEKVEPSVSSMEAPNGDA